MRKLRFLIVPDKFKGSLTAREVAEIMAWGIRDALPSANIKTIPLGDGGDGTGMILARATHAHIVRSHVRGPLGRIISAAWGLKGSTAYIDLASTSGLALVPLSRCNPLKTSTFGLGEVMREAVQRGARKLVLGVGGSATVDGGMGAMKALGVRFLDRHGKEIPEGGGNLLLLSRVDAKKCCWRGLGVELTILADVTNPLLGKSGAAAVFGPQKGATPAAVRRLDSGLKRLNQVIISHHGKSLAGMVSGGAAGGIAAGFRSILGSVKGVKVRVVPGIDYVLDVLSVKASMRRVDWVLTGEGQLDAQTAQGKTIQGVTRLAAGMKKPVIAFAGKVVLGSAHIRAMGLTAAFGIAPVLCTLEESMKHSRRWLRNSVADVVRLICHRHTHGNKFVRL